MSGERKRVGLTYATEGEGWNVSQWFLNGNGAKKTEEESRIPVRELTPQELSAAEKMARQALYQITHRQDYLEYLASEEWQTRRLAQLDATPWCAVCPATTNLDVHHRIYDRLGHEHEQDLVVLCRTCHDVFHRAGRVYG